MKTMAAIMVIVTVFVLSVPALAGMDAESEVVSLGQVIWDDRLEAFSGRDFQVIISINNFAVCREVVENRCTPIVSEPGTPAVMFRGGQQFPLVLPRIGDF